MVGSWQIGHVDASASQCVVVQGHTVGFSFLHIPFLVHVSVKHPVDAASHGCRKGPPQLEVALCYPIWWFPEMGVAQNGWKPYLKKRGFGGTPFQDLGNFYLTIPYVDMFTISSSQPSYLVVNQLTYVGGPPSCGCEFMVDIIDLGMSTVERLKLKQRTCGARLCMCS